MSSIDTSSAMLVVIDCEGNYRDGSANLTRTLQLSFPNHKVSVVHLSKLSIFTPATFPPTLKNLLELENLLFCGRNVSIDCNRMEALGVQLLKRFELRDAALHDDPDMNGISLENLASNYLGLSLNKSHRDDDFSAHPLPIHLQRYSALDALVSRKLGEVLKLKHQNVTNDIPATLHLEVGDNMNYIIGSKVSASETLAFVGGNGLQTRYGGTTVGANKALFQIEQIKMPNSKPSSIANKFYTSNLTMKDIALHVNLPINIVRTLSIEKSLPVDESYSLICNNLQQRNIFESEESIIESVANDAANEIAANELNEISTNELNESNVREQVNDSIVLMSNRNNDYSLDSDVDENAVRSRIKEDLFHRFQDFPLPRGCPIKPAGINLLIMSTFRFYKEDYKEITEVLRSKGASGFNEHFYYNKECWRKRVRMTMPSCSEYARSVKMIEALFQVMQPQKSTTQKNFKCIFQICSKNASRVISNN